MKGQTLCWDEAEGEKVKKLRERAAGDKEALYKSRTATNRINIFAWSRRFALEAAINL